METIDRLVVTVGTSLFASASWENVGEFAKMPGYRRWCTSLLERPSERRASNPRTPGRIEEHLRAKEPDARRVFAWPGRPLRYGAELSTLVNWMHKSGCRDLGNFLNETYRQVDLVAPSDREDAARVAAEHLRGVLEERIGVRAVRVAGVLTSPSIQDRVEQFQRYLGDLARESVDLVVSGGYKVFAMVAAVFASTPGRESSRRVIYVHEDNFQELIVQEGAALLEIGDRRITMLGPETL